MGISLAIEFWILAILSTWMTATAILVLKGRRQLEEEMRNLYEQVIGAVRKGDLPRAILILEGEPGPLAAILSSVLIEATKFTPKLRVAYKVTLESLKRRSHLRTNPLRIVSLVAALIGVIGLVVPFAALLAGNPPAWAHAFLLLLLAVIISAIAYGIQGSAERQAREGLEAAGDLGKQMLSYLLSPESPLRALRGQAFPPPQ